MHIRHYSYTRGYLHFIQSCVLHETASFSSHGLIITEGGCPPLPWDTTIPGFLQLEICYMGYVVKEVYYIHSFFIEYVQKPYLQVLHVNIYHVYHHQSAGIMVSYNKTKLSETEEIKCCSSSTACETSLQQNTQKRTSITLAVVNNKLEI